MTRNDFLDTLRKRLAQTLPQEKVAEHVRYYDSYLAEKISTGMPEEEAVEQLGDPLLIAKTIMDTSGGGGSRGVVFEERPERENSWTADQEDDRQSGRNRQISIRTRGGCLLAALILILVLAVVLWLVGSVVSFLLPVLVPVMVITMVISYFKQK